MEPVTIPRDMMPSRLLAFIFRLSDSSQMLLSNSFAFREIFFHALYPALQKQINHQGKQRVVFSLLVVPAHEKQQEDNEQVLCA